MLDSQCSQAAPSGDRLSCLRTKEQASIGGSSEVFCALTVGFWAQPQAHTVTGMLMAAGLSATWHHSRAHRFFSAVRWSADQLSVVLLDLILAVLIPAGAPVRLVVDDILFRRSGRKVFAAAWHHDPLGVGRNAVAWGNNWVVVGVLVDLPFLPTGRSACPPGPAVVVQAHSRTTGAGHRTRHGYLPAPRPVPHRPGL